MNLILLRTEGIKAITQIVASLILLSGVSIASATTIELVNRDSAGEGFRSNSSPFSGQTGNSGSTLGQQRLNVFRAAADYWEERLIITAPIKVGINFDPLFCEPSRGVLGSAGPEFVFRDFPNAPLSSTWYVGAVADSLAGSDLDPGFDDIGARFNSSIDNNNNCLFGTNWWLGINSPAPAGTISLFDTVLHEIGHGLGFLSLVALSNIFDQNGRLVVAAGERFLGLNDAYSYHLFDELTRKFWRNMSNAERVFSSINGPNLTWRGPNADNNSNHLNSSLSRTNGNIRMYAPSSVELGSSVSHWDTSLSPDELMEPIATQTSDDRSTLQLLKDVGWGLVEKSKITLAGIISLLLDDESP